MEALAAVVALERVKRAGSDGRDALHQLIYDRGCGGVEDGSTAGIRCRT
jgi:hypothetical protein